VILIESEWGGVASLVSQNQAAMTSKEVGGPASWGGVSPAAKSLHAKSKNIIFTETSQNQLPSPFSLTVGSNYVHL